MEAQICMENGNVVSPLLNERPGSRMLAGGVGNSKLRQQFVTWLHLKDGGLLVHFLDLGCCSSSCAAPLGHPSETLGLHQPLRLVRFFMSSKAIWQKRRQ